MRDNSQDSSSELSKKVVRLKAIEGAEKQARRMKHTARQRGGIWYVAGDGAWNLCGGKS